MAKSVSSKSKSNPKSHSTRAPSTRSGAKKSAPAARTVRGPRKRKASQPSFFWDSISNDRKLDILGVFLALVGFLTLLSLISSENGTLTGMWISTLNKISGWGTFVLPVGLIIIGLWLVMRNVEQLPLLSTERIFGIVLLYLNLLAWLHFFAGGTWELAAQGVGGGYVGAFFNITLVNALGKAGGVIVMASWLVIALVFAFDLSIPEIYRAIKPVLGGMQRQLDKRLHDPAPSHGRRAVHEPEGHDLAPGELPSDFRPLPGHASPRSTEPQRNRSSLAERASAVSKAGMAPESEVTMQHITRAGALASAWKLPPVDQILEPATPAAQQSNFDQDRARLIEETLASFGAPCHVVDISRGPTITRFGVEPDFIESRTGKMRVRVSKIASLADDLALALAAPRIRIQAPVPGRSYVGIEVPNTEISRVAMREVLDSDVFRRMKSALRFTLGKDVAGKPVAGDLSAMPHLLIAGTTGSGKSVCVNSILTSLLLHNTPADIRLVLVDPKRVELTGYNGIPHLLAPVVVDTERVVGALQWLQREMDARYHKFSSSGTRNIQDYNAKNADRLPYLVAVIDELADLMMLSPDETERAITRLAQLARATGIHLIIATQRPSVDVVTGLIKANFPARVAFAVASSVDSRVILDQPGAERLLGRGDMLFQAPDAPAPVRLQGVYVSDVEISRLVDYWRTQAALVQSQQPQADGESAPDMLPEGLPLKQAPLWDAAEVGGDPLYADSVDLVRREGRASITMLQRRLRVGYTRAARLIDAMEEKGVISPALPNSQVREVLDYGENLPAREE
ncbi:MAG: FtsK/SpoIIIE family DNA translocase [Bellilinea sp.]